MLNPYDRFLGDRDPVEVLAATPVTLGRLISELGPEGWPRSYRPGAWAARDILRHLADNELAFAFRLRQGLAEPRHVIQPYDQDAWHALNIPQPIEAVLASFTAVRAANLALWKEVATGQHDKPVSHPERGEMTLRQMVETVAGHDLNHLGQLESTLGQQAGLSHLG